MCQWREALMFSLICAWMTKREAGDLRRRRAHYDITVIDMFKKSNKYDTSILGQT